MKIHGRENEKCTGTETQREKERDSKRAAERLLAVAYLQDTRDAPMRRDCGRDCDCEATNCKIGQRTAGCRRLADL